MPFSHAAHGFASFLPRVHEGLTVVSRRSTLKASLAGMAGLSLPRLLEARAPGVSGEPSISSSKSVILLWMAGGPSQIDIWDPKPDRPRQNRGPFSTIPTKIPGVRVCEHIPKQAALMDRLTIIRSMDPRGSNHQPNQVWQTGHREAAPRINPRGDKYPAIGSLVGKHAPGRDRSMPQYVALNVLDRTHFAWGGYLGQHHDPFVADRTQRLFELPHGLTLERLRLRKTLLGQFDNIRRDLDLTGAMTSLDRFQAQALELVAGQRIRDVLDVAQEPERVRDRYGEHDWAQKALLARRLVESGVGFVTIDLSNHRSSGTWDNHGDNIPPYGGISRGLKPLLPVFDHVFTTLVLDLEERGLLDDTLVLALGEFGRTPNMGTQGSTDGRNHWPRVMSMVLAGGGFRHGQVIGASTPDGGAIKERPVTPGDLAATIYHHMGVPLDLTYEDPNGRPHLAVQENGQPIRELL